MISFNPTALTRETPSFQRKAKTRNIFPRKTFQNLTKLSLIVSTFKHISRFSSKIPQQTTALQCFKTRAMAEMNSQFTIDEDQEMETQPIYLSSDESEIESLCSSPIPQLPNNPPDTYSAITQLIAAQHEQMSLCGTSAPQFPITPQTSLISEDENDEVFTPIIGNTVQFLPYTPNRHPISGQLRQQMTTIPDTPVSPTPEKRGQSDDFYPDNIPLNNPPKSHRSSRRIAQPDTAPPSPTQRSGDKLFNMWQILRQSHRRDCCRLS